MKVEYPEYKRAKSLKKIDTYQLRISPYCIGLSTCSPLGILVIGILFLILSTTSCSTRFVAAPDNALDISVVTQPSQIDASPLDIYRPDWVNMKLNGRVKLLHEVMYGASIKDGKIKKEKELVIHSSTDDNKIIRFNESGKIIEEKCYLSSGKPRKIFSTETRYYSPDGNIVEEVYLNIRYDNQWVIKYFYDSEGVITKKLLSQSGTSKRSKTEDFSYSEDFLYDSLSRVLTVTTSVSKKVHQYDEDGNRIVYKYFDPADSVSYAIKYRYDDRGNLLEEAAVSREGVIWKRIVYENDEQDNPTASLGYREKDEFVGKQTYQYTYDNHHNWIRKVTYSNDTPISIIERVIEYY